MDRAKDIDVHCAAAQRFPALHDPRERALPALVHAVGVVERLRSVHAQADEEVVLPEEGGPFVVEPGAVGLDGVQDALAGLAVLRSQLDDAAEEVQPHQRRLAALPRDIDLGRSLLRLQQLPDV